MGRTMNETIRILKEYEREAKESDPYLEELEHDGAEVEVNDPHGQGTY